MEALRRCAQALALLPIYSSRMSAVTEEVAA
jgi:hypothetical protein